MEKRSSLFDKIFSKLGKSEIKVSEPKDAETTSQYIESMVKQITYNDGGKMKTIRYIDLGNLGEGSFGQVKRVEFFNAKDLGLEQKLYALKQVRLKMENQEGLDRALNEQYIIDRVQKESGCLKEFVCYYFPNDNPIFDKKDNSVYFISELMDGSLSDLIKRYPKIQDRIKIANEIIYPTVLKGIQIIHSIGIIHSDIKMDNILFSDKNKSLEVKIGDLGSSCTKIFNPKLMKSEDPECSKCKVCKNTFRGTYSYVDPFIFKEYIVEPNQETTWIYETDYYGLAIVLLNFVLGKSILRSDALKRYRFAENPEQSKAFLKMYIMELSNAFVNQIINNEKEWIAIGLDKQVFEFIKETTLERLKDLYTRSFNKKFTK